MARVEDARLDVYWPFTSGGPDLQVPQEDIREIDFTSSYQAGRGDGRLVIDNGPFGSGGKYNGDAGDNERVAEIDLGHKIEVRVLTEHNDSTTTLDDEAARRWTALVNGITASTTGEGNLLEVDVEDFVFGRLARQTLVTSYKNRQVATAPGGNGIVNDILSRVENVDDGGVTAVDTPQTIGWNYDNLLEGLRTLAKRSGSIMASDDTSLIWKDTLDLSVDLPVGASYYHLPVEMGSNDDDFGTTFYVTGGTGNQLLVSQTNAPDRQSLTTRIESSPVTLTTPKISRVDVYTEAINSENSIRCRIQNASEDGAVAPNVRGRDLGSATVDADNLTQTGFTTFDVDVDGGGVNASNTVAIILEQVSEGSITAGQEHQIGGEDTDGDNVLENVAYKIYRPYPVIGVAEDATAKTDYRPQESRIRTNTRSTDEASSVAQSALQRANVPEESITLEAAGPSLHQTNPADVLLLDIDSIRAIGEYVVTRVEQRYQANQLTTTVDAISTDSL